MGQSKKKETEKNDKEKRDSRVKTRKGGLEQKRENFQGLVGRVNRTMKR